MKNTSGAYGSVFFIAGDNTVSIGDYSNTYGTINFYIGGSVAAAIDSATSDFYTNDGTVSSLSDRRLKKDIKPISFGLDEINRLNPVTFKYNDKGWNKGIDKREKIGFVYQDIEPILPIVTGHTDVDGVQYGTVSQDKLIPILVKAIQELSAKVSKLENKIKEN